MTQSEPERRKLDLSKFKIRLLDKSSTVSVCYKDIERLKSQYRRLFQKLLTEKNTDERVDDIELIAVLQKMLLEIEYEDKTSFTVKNSAYDWVHGCDDEFLDSVIKRLFEKGFEFSEKREDQIRVTVEELILNSSWDYEKREDLFLECSVYFGKKGIVITIKDNGPGFDVYTKTMEAKQSTVLTEEQVLYGRADYSYPGGTGMYCLLNFTQAFRYSKKGNQVLVRFDISPEVVD